MADNDHRNENGTTNFFLLQPPSSGVNMEGVPPHPPAANSYLLPQRPQYIVELIPSGMSSVLVFVPLPTGFHEHIDQYMDNYLPQQVVGSPSVSTHVQRANSPLLIEPLQSVLLCPPVI